MCYSTSHHTTFLKQKINTNKNSTDKKIENYKWSPKTILLVQKLASRVVAKAKAHSHSQEALYSFEYDFRRLFAQKQEKDLI
jgi:hypothetical protein